MASKRRQNQKSFRIVKKALEALEKLIGKKVDKAGLDASVRRLEKMRSLSQKLRTELDKELELDK